MLLELHHSTSASTRLSYCGITSLTSMQRFATTLQAILDTKGSMIEKLMGFAVFNGVDFDVEVIELARVDLVDVVNEFKEFGEAEANGDEKEARKRLFSAVYKNPVLDLLERLFIVVFGFASVNVSRGGLIHQFWVEDDEKEMLKEKSADFLEFMKQQSLSFSSSSSSSSSSSATSLSLAAIVEKYVKIMNAAPQSLRGRAVYDALKSMYINDASPAQNRRFQDGSTNAIIIGKDITMASFLNKTSFFDPQTGQGPQLYSTTNEWVDKIIPGSRNFNLPFVDLWIYLTHKLVSLMLLFWIVPVLRQKRPVIVRALGAKTFLSLSNLCFNLERCLCGTSSLPPSESLKQLQDRYRQYFIEGVDLDEISFLDKDGNCVEDVASLKSRSEKALKSIEMGLTMKGICEEENETDLNWKVEVCDNFGFIGDFVGSPRIVTYGIDYDEDVTIAIPNIDPGYRKYGEVISAVVCRIIFLTEVLSRLLERGSDIVWNDIISSYPALSKKARQKIT